jgi:hypothetical protein
VFLREWFSGKIRLEPLVGGGLMAHWNQNATALLRNRERVVAGLTSESEVAENQGHTDSVNWQALPRGA